MEEKRYREYIALAKKITKGDGKYQDLLHDVLIQLDNNEKWNNIFTKEEKMYYLSRALRNQFYSNNSKFQRTYKRFVFDQIEGIEQIDIEYQEKPTIDWIKEMLEKQLETDPKFWYNKGIFELWMEHNGFIDRVYKQTKIPKYSLIETINEVKQLIKNKWENRWEK